MGVGKLMVSISAIRNAGRKTIRFSHLIFIPASKKSTLATIRNICYKTKSMTPKQIVKLRKDLDVTQEQLAEIIGAFRETVARWETGQNKPRGANLKALKELEAK